MPADRPHDYVVIPVDPDIAGYLFKVFPEGPDQARAVLANPTSVEYDVLEAETFLSLTGTPSRPPEGGFRTPLGLIVMAGACIVFAVGFIDIATRIVQLRP